MARYELNDIEYPSVTEILGIIDKSSALCAWAVNCYSLWIQQNCDKIGGAYEVSEDDLLNAKANYKDVSKEARDIGSEVHFLIEQYIKAQIDGVFLDLTAHDYYRDEVENGFLAFLDWEKTHVNKWIASELIVHTESYAGQLDAIAEMKTGEIFVIDFKSSKAIYPEYKMQIAAYAYAWYVDDDANEFDGVGILRLDKVTGLPEWKDTTKSYDKDLNSFTKLTDFYYSYKKRRLKNNLRALS